MTVIAVVCQKGGTGKTTLALHVAAAASAGRKVALVLDTDPQASASTWSRWREGAAPAVVSTHPPLLADAVKEAYERGAEVIVIDTSPHAESAVREAVKVADLILVPCRPRALDLASVRTTAGLIRTTGKDAFVVFNATPARGTRLIEEVGGMVKEMGLNVCPVNLAERAAYANSIGAGKTAPEIEPSGKAAGEVEDLWKWIKKETGITSSKKRVSKAA